MSVAFIAAGVLTLLTGLNIFASRGGSLRSSTVFLCLLGVVWLFYGLFLVATDEWG